MEAQVGVIGSRELKKVKPVEVAKGKEMDSPLEPPQ